MSRPVGLIKILISLTSNHSNHSNPNYNPCVQGNVGEKTVLRTDARGLATAEAAPNKVLHPKLPCLPMTRYTVREAGASPCFLRKTCILLACDAAFPREAVVA